MLLNSLWPLLLCCSVSLSRGELDCAAENQAEVSFDTPSLKGKKCSDVDRDYCIFTGEVKKNCPCLCKKLIYGDETTPGTDGPVTEKPCIGGKKKCKRKAFCFHGDDTVMTENGHLVTMKQLAESPHIRVMTGEEFSDVRYWLHAEKDTIATFLVLSTSADHRLRISEEHLIYRSVTCRQTDMDTVFARRLRVGHCLRVHDPRTGRFILSPIANLTRTTATGIYAPITRSGSIVVNGVLASCYTNFENEAVQKMMYGMLLDGREWLGKWGPLRWIGEAIFGDRTENAVAHIPTFVYSLLDLSPYFVHA